MTSKSHLSSGVDDVKAVGLKKKKKKQNKTKKRFLGASSDLNYKYVSVIQLVGERTILVEGKGLF